MTQVTDEQVLKPLSWGPTLIIFLITAVVLYVAHTIVAPAYMAATGQPYLVAYLIVWVTTMGLVSAAVLIAYKGEGRPFTRQAFGARHRLYRVQGADWLWLLGMFVFSLATYSALSFTATWLASMPLFAPHPAFPPDLGPGTAGALVPGVLFGMPLKGQWWLILVYAIGWLLNVIGEELWYRGWMLPRQELAFGKHAWLINALMFTFQHTFQPWNYLAMLPGSLFVVYAAQRRCNTSLSLIWHSVLNVSLLLFIIQGVIG